MFLKSLGNRLFGLTFFETRAGSLRKKKYLRSGLMLEECSFPLERQTLSVPLPFPVIWLLETLLYRKLASSLLVSYWRLYPKLSFGYRIVKVTLFFSLPPYLTVQNTQPFSFSSSAHKDWSLVKNRGKFFFYSLWEFLDFFYRVWLR